MFRKSIKALVATLLVITTIVPSRAQTGIEVNINYTTEFFYGFAENKANWANILDVDFSRTLWRGGSVRLNLLSSDNLRASRGKEPIAPDLEIFSGIEEESASLSMFIFGISQHIGISDVFLGVRNVNEDYFDTPWNSLFTSPSNGLYPCISEGYPLADAPRAALCLHSEMRFSPRWLYKSSLYNGVATGDWLKVFNFRPRKQGILAISELSYTGREGSYVGSYHLGTVFGDCYDEERGEKVKNDSFWLLVEQPLYLSQSGRTLQLLLQGGYSTTGTCRGYFGAGAVWRGLLQSDDYIGLLAQRTFHKQGDETDWELTYAMRFGAAQVQPALHLLFGGDKTRAIGVLKVVMEFD